MFNAQNRIRQLMAERGWTIYRLAQESKLSQTTISNIFKRNNQPSLPTVNAICDACGITLAQFFTENDTANSPNAKSELDKLKHQSIPILEQMLTSLQLIRNRKMLWSPDIVALNKRISDLSSQNQTLAFLKQQGLVDPDIFIAKTNELTKQLRQVKLEKEKLMDAESDMTALQTRDLIDILEGGPEFLDSFDTELFGELVEKIIIEGNDSVRFCLKNGLELRESIERTVR